APPGVTTTFSPSTKGDSEKPHSGRAAPKSLLKPLRQSSLPAAVSKQTRSPHWPTAYRKSPSNVGVARGPSKLPHPTGPDFASFAFQIGFPVVSSAITKLESALSPIVKIRLPTTETVE